MKNKNKTFAGCGKQINKKDTFAEGTLFKGERLNVLCVCHADGVKQIHRTLTF